MFRRSFLKLLSLSPVALIPSDITAITDDDFKVGDKAYGRRTYLSTVWNPVKREYRTVTKYRTVTGIIRSITEFKHTDISLHLCEYRKEYYVVSEEKNDAETFQKEHLTKIGE